MVRIAIDNLGCKLNQAEAQLLARQFSEAGCELVSSAAEADIYILNTCTVTHIADRKSRHMLRLARRQNPGARLVVTGCYAERSPEELTCIDGVDLVLDNVNKSNLVQRLRESGFLSPSAPTNASIPCFDGWRTRAFIKVQDGCHNYCTYCIVPFVRREEVSVPVAQVISEVRERVAGGVQEAVLTGTEVGAYRCDDADLKGLLERILSETDIRRLRLSSLQPQEISPELISLWHDSRLCAHFHLSLQSGSDSVLRRMKRGYTVAGYRRAVSLIREIVPEAALTTDIIVGFPDETEAEFQESLDFCREIAFARIHVFPYSSRQGTEAARMPNQIAAETKKQRSQKMLALAKVSAQNFHRRFLGRVMPVLWEQQKNGIWSGLTDNYIKVYTRSPEDLTNKLLPVTLEKVWRDGVWGLTNSNIKSQNSNLM